MLKLLRSEMFAVWGATALVFVSAAIVGRQAAIGMNLIQWLGAAVAIGGSVTLAVFVRVWPAPAPARDNPFAARNPERD